MEDKKKGIVAQCVIEHALIDKHLTAAWRAAMRMVENVEDGVRAGMITQLEAKLFLAEHRAAAGDIENVAVTFAKLHIKGTDIAKANGVDLGTMSTAGGVELVQPKSGTR